MNLTPGGELCSWPGTQTMFLVLLIKAGWKFRVSAMSVFSLFFMIFCRLFFLDSVFIVFFPSLTIRGKLDECLALFAPE